MKPDTFQLVLPEPTRNIVTNPSVEIDATGWTAVGSTITRTTDEARGGRASLQVVTDGTAALEGCYFRAKPNASNGIYAASVYVLGSGAVRIRMKDGFNGQSYPASVVALDEEVWQRLEVTGALGPVTTDDLRLYVETTEAEVITFYVDGAQLEAKDEPTTYIDGSLPGGRWNVRRHGSVSDRLASSSLGGRVVSIDEDDLGVYLTEVTGVGVPPIRHNLQARALLAGQEYQSSVTQSRVMQFVGWTRERKSDAGFLGALRTPGIDRILRNRQALIDAVKPDRAAGSPMIAVRYKPGLVPFEIDALYEAGLEFDGDIRNPWTNTFAMRLLAAEEPYWKEDNQQVQSLEGYAPLVINHMVGRINGEWTNFDGGATDPTSGTIVSMAQGIDGQIYFGGRFTSIGGVGANNIARWDGSNFYPLGTGTNVNVLNIAIGPDGRVYVVGSFTSAGGVVGTNRVAVWDPDTETWDDLAGGLDGSAFSAAFAPDGTLYVVGRFDTAGATGAANIASWNGSGWSALGAGLLFGGLAAPASGLEVAIGPDGTVYVGGVFDSAGAVTTDNIAQFTPSTATWAEMGSGGADDGVTAVAVSPDGRVYAGGNFTTISGASAARAAVWNGASWSALGDGVDSNVRWIFIAADGTVWYVGDFDSASSIPNTRRIARWNGSAWLPSPVAIPSTITRCRTLLVLGDDLYFGLGDDVPGETVYTPTRVEVDNRGTAKSYPVFYFRRDGGTSATIVSVFHEESGLEIILTYAMADGEEVEIDLRPGIRTVRSSLASSSITLAEILQNRLGDVTPGSDFATWALFPGDGNHVQVFVVPEGNPSVDASMRWVPYHWSFDAAAL